MELEPVDGASEALRAYAYMKQEHQMGECVAIEGPFPEYTQELAVGYWLAAA